MYSQKKCFELIQEMAINRTSIYACCGAKSKFLRQMMSDLYESPVLTIENKEDPALGVAILASVACGIYKNTQQYKSYYSIYKDLYAHLKDSFENSINFYKKTYIVQLI